jgi:hypothetical protein
MKNLFRLLHEDELAAKVITQNLVEKLFTHFATFKFMPDLLNPALNVNIFMQVNVETKSL